MKPNTTGWPVTSNNSTNIIYIYINLCNNNNEELFVKYLSPHSSDKTGDK